MGEYRLIINCQRLGRSSKYGVYFSYDVELINKIKLLPDEDRKYVPDHKLWEINVRGLLQLLKQYRGSPDVHFDFGTTKSRKIFVEQLKKYEAAEKEKLEAIKILDEKKKQWIEFKKTIEKDYEKYSENIHSFLKEGTKLYPYQVAGAMFIDKVRNVLLACDMGTGKSVISIAYVEMNDFEKIVVITPNSLKFNYYNEVEKFTNSKAHIVNWKKNKYTIEESKYIILNYEFFNSKDKEKTEIKFNSLNIGNIDVIICDESSRIKSSKSNTYHNFKKIFNNNIFKNKKISKVFLSGTPMPSRSAELYTVLNQISQIDFPTKKFFLEYYCGMHYNLNDYGWTKDEENTRFEELFHKIAPYIYRKRKIDVLPDLPEKTYQKVMLEMSEPDYITYNRIEEGLINDFLKYPTQNPLTIMLRLRQYTASLKISHVIELIEQVLETGEKVVVVDYFKDALYELKKRFGEIAGLYTGDQTIEERNDIEKDFQNPQGKYKIFLGTIQTCGFGLTLTAASILFIISLPFTYGEYDQVSSRLHRIGTKSAVNIYSLIFGETIDEFVYNLIESKIKEIVKVLDNEDYKSNIKESIVGEVIAIIKKRHGK